jgi:hypothetical protein
MYVRITTVTGASDIDEGLGFLRDVVLPQLQRQNNNVAFFQSPPSSDLYPTRPGVDIERLTAQSTNQSVC